MSARTRTPRTALLPLAPRPSTRARRADRQISSRPHPSANPRAGNAPASKLLTYGTAAASLLTHYSRAHHRVGLTPRGLFAAAVLSRWLTSQFAFTAPGEACFGLYLLPPFATSSACGRQSTRDAPSHPAVVSWASRPCSARTPRSMAQARRFIERVHPKPRSGGLSARFPFVAALLFPGFSPATDDADVHGGRREVRDKVFTLLAGVRLFWSHGARSSSPPSPASSARSSRVGGGRSGLDPARVGVRVNGGDAGGWRGGGGGAGGAVGDGPRRR